MKKTRKARLFGRAGQCQEQFLKGGIEECKKEMLQEIKDRGWLPIGDVKVSIIGGYIYTMYGCSVPCVFVGKKKVLMMKPLKAPKTIKISRVN